MASGSSPLALKLDNAAINGARADAVRYALAASLVTGTFTDTVYHLFSRRLANGNVGSPRTVYANSTILKATGDYFVAQLSGDFATAQSAVRETDTYSYEDDSDIEDGGEEAFDEEQDSSSPSCSKDKGKEKELESNEHMISVGPHSKLDVKYSIFVPDVAANTWQALVYYMYTGCVNFAPLRSQGLVYRAHVIVEHHEQNPDLPILCSPKSLYRLADIVGLDSLKFLAREDIKRKISKSNVMEECFSRISSAYPEILDAQLAFLYKDGLLAQLIPPIQEKIKLITEGQIPHAENMLNALLGKLSLLLLEGEGTRHVPAGNTGAWSTEEGSKNNSKSDGERSASGSPNRGYIESSTFSAISPATQPETSSIFAGWSQASSSTTQATFSTSDSLATPQGRSMLGRGRESQILTKQRGMGKRR